MLFRAYLFPVVLSASLPVLSILLYSWNRGLSQIQRQICPEVLLWDARPISWKFRPIRSLERLWESKQHLWITASSTKWRFIESQIFWWTGYSNGLWYTNVSSTSLLGYHTRVSIFQQFFGISRFDDMVRPLWAKYDYPMVPLLTFSRQIMINIVAKSGLALHNILVETVMNAPMQLFAEIDSEWFWTASVRIWPLSMRFFLPWLSEQCWVIEYISFATFSATFVQMANFFANKI